MEIDNELQTVATELIAANHLASVARHHLNELVDKWSGAPRQLSTAALILLLSYEGRVVESTAGVPPLGEHLRLLADATRWEHSSVRRWVKLALEHPPGWLCENYET